jgi:hypothetical protein
MTDWPNLLTGLLGMGLYAGFCWRSGRDPDLLTSVLVFGEGLTLASVPSAVYDVFVRGVITDDVRAVIVIGSLVIAVACLRAFKNAIAGAET